MENKHYVTVQSFWMFVSGLVVGLLLVLATIMMQTKMEGQADVLRYTESTLDRATTEYTLDDSALRTTDEVSGVAPGFMPTTDEVSGVAPGFMPTTDEVSGVAPGF